MHLSVTIRRVFVRYGDSADERGASSELPVNSPARSGADFVGYHQVVGLEGPDRHRSDWQPEQVSVTLPVVEPP